jgi:peptide/nickel transport system substrate-binding protein
VGSPATAAGSPAAASADIQTPTGAKSGGILTYLASADPPYLDPHRASSVQMPMVTQVYARLLHFDAAAEKLQPELAASWAQPDATTYTFSLRQGVKFHSGDELTSEDVKFSLERIGQLGVDKPDPQMAQSWMLTDVASIETPDRYTVVVKMKQPSAPTLSYLGVQYNGIVNKQFTLGNDLNTKMNGTGPFKLREWKRNQEISFARHTEYFWAKAGLPYLDGWRAITTPDTGAINAAFVSGQMLGSFPNGFSSEAKDKDRFLGQIPDLQYIGRDATFWSYFDMNKRKAGWSDVRVRKAVQLAINQNDVGDRTEDGEFSLQGPVAAGFPFYSLSQDEIKQMPGFRQPKDQDIADAKKLLAAAGYGPDNPLKGINITTPLHPYYEPISLAVKANLAPLGIDLQMREYPDYASLLEARAKFDFDTYGWSRGGPDYVDQYFSESFPSASPLNFGGWNDPKTDDLLAKQRAALDRNERKKIIDELSHYFMLEVHPQAFVPTLHGYVWWRKPYHADKAFITPSYTAFFGQFTWLDLIPANMKSFTSF